MPLRLLNLKPGSIPQTRVVPYSFLPLVEANAQGRELVPVVRDLVKVLGFDSFAYALSTISRPDKDAQLFVFTTMPAEWMVIYDQKAYVELTIHACN